MSENHPLEGLLKLAYIDQLSKDFGIDDNCNEDI